MIKWLLNKAFGPKVVIGTFEKIDLTFGQLGQQVTTIDGQTYWTWWDYKTWPKAGDKVEVKVWNRGEYYRSSYIKYKEAVLVRVIEASPPPPVPPAWNSLSEWSDERLALALRQALEWKDKNAGWDSVSVPDAPELDEVAHYYRCKMPEMSCPHASAAEWVIVEASRRWLKFTSAGGKYIV